MTERPKLTIKRPLSLEKQTQLFQVLKPLKTELDKDKHQHLDQQKRKEKEEKRKKIKEIKEAFSWLCEHFPKCFNLENLIPLKLNIDKDIYPYLDQDRAPSRIKIRNALKYYTHNINYMKNLINSTHRYDLKGQEVEQITQEQKDFAQEKLVEIKQLMKAKKQHKNKSFK